MKKLVIAVLLTPLMVSAMQQQKPAPLDAEELAKIEIEAAAIVKRLNAPSPTASELQKLAELEDNYAEVRQKDPASPHLKAIKQKIDILVPFTPLELICQIAVKI